MKITNNKWVNVITVILGTIVLGAIGSGTWDLLFEPLGRYILSFVSLIFSYLEKSVYMEIAKGYKEHHSIIRHLLFTLIAFIVFSSYFSNLFIRLIPIFLSLESFANKFNKYKTIESPEELVKAKDDLDKLETTYKKSLFKDKKVTQFLGIMFVFFFSLFLFDYSKFTYVNSAVSHFNQCYTICLPYFDTKEAILIKSKFAQIHSKGDYIKALKLLEKVAHDNSIELPSFKPW